MHDLISPTHVTHRGCTPTRRSVHSDEPTGEYYNNTSRARARPRLPTAKSDPGTRSTRWYTFPVRGCARGIPICTVNGDFSRKMTYSPDEPRGWTPRLMVYGNEWTHSWIERVASSYNSVTLVEDDALVEHLSRSAHRGVDRCLSQSHSRTSGLDNPSTEITNDVGGQFAQAKKC